METVSSCIRDLSCVDQLGLFHFHCNLLIISIHGSKNGVAFIDPSLYFGVNTVKVIRLTGNKEVIEI